MTKKNNKEFTEKDVQDFFDIFKENTPQRKNKIKKKKKNKK
ncbi:MAG: hypothetical protein PHP92_04010 [Candidatus Nanoarchaeia archaeon]|nr:hypothetical protein [Candidatus Nanoarchaeia archaeon]